MIRATRALMVLLPMSAACAEWPRFANLPPPDAAGVEPPPVLTTKIELVEPAAPGWPDEPGLLPPEQQTNLGELWQVTRLTGTLSPFGQEGGDKLPFSCGDEPSPLAYTAESDIDWLHLWSDGGPLCLLLETSAADAEWDVLVHPFDPELFCVGGPPLNPLGSTDLPVVTTPGTNTFLVDVPLGPLGIYVAGVSGGSGDAPYAIHVVPATVAETCEALLVTDIDPAVEAP